MTEAPRGRWAEFPVEIIVMVAEIMPYGRDVLSLSMACRAYQTILKRILYVRFATMPTVSHEGRWTTISSKKSAANCARDNGRSNTATCSCGLFTTTERKVSKNSSRFLGKTFFALIVDETKTFALIFEAASRQRTWKQQKRAR